MFAYNELTKDNNVATISLDGSYEHNICVEAPSERDEDFSDFTL